MDNTSPSRCSHPPAKILSGRFSTTFTPISTPHATGGSFLLAAFAVNGKHLAEDGNYKISALYSLVSRERKGQAQIGMIIARSKRDPVAEFGILLMYRDGDVWCGEVRGTEKKSVGVVSQHTETIIAATTNNKQQQQQHHKLNNNVECLV